MLAQPNDKNNTSAGLGAWGQDGATWVYSLLASSPANDGGGGNVLGISTDQRGVSRPQNSAFDIGAYETTLAPTSDNGGGDNSSGASGGSSGGGAGQSSTGQLGETGEIIRQHVWLGVAGLSTILYLVLRRSGKHLRYKLH